MIMKEQYVDVPANSPLFEGFTKEDILSYLSTQARKAGSNTFTIQYNQQNLANYLAVDRSSLSSELNRMQREGLLTFNRNVFTLHRMDVSQEKAK